MGEFVGHLLEHRSLIGRPLGFVRVVTVGRQGDFGREKGGGYGSRRGEHYPAERRRYWSVCEFLIVPLFSAVSAISEGIKQK